MSVRRARLSDEDAIAEILARTSAQDPSWDYRCPYRHLHPDDFKDACQQKSRQYLDDLTVVVYEVSEATGNQGETTRVVAFGCWELVLPSGSEYRHFAPAPRGSAPATTTAKSPKRHAVPYRSKAFKDQCAAAAKRLFDDRFQNGHMFLKVLYCHPEYQRRGAGRALASWGIRVARLAQIPTTLFASPAGKPLYESLGFKTVGEFRVQADGDDGYLDVPAMVLDPESPPDDIWGRVRVVVERVACIIRHVYDAGGAPQGIRHITQNTC